MSVLRRGDEGQEVAELQERLRELGFDAEGEYGEVTELAVIRFQESRGLLPDGVVGPITREALADAEPGGGGGGEEEGAGPPVDRSLRLDAGQFLSEPRPKDLIVLHHTAGASAASTVHFWNEDDPPIRIATAYVIARDGTIHEVFEPRFWAFHLGLAGSGGRVDRRSIGIELANEGVLVREGDRFFAFRDPEDADPPGTVYTGDRVDLDQPWRGARHFAAYTEEQVASAVALTDHLCAVFGIPRKTPGDHLSFDRDLWDFRGVVGHHHLRPDKTDLHPGFPWHRLVEGAELELVPEG